MMFLSVRLSVTRVYCDEMRDPVVFIFGSSYPLNDGNSHPNGPPTQRGLWGPPAIWDSMGTNSPNTSNRNEIWQKHAEHGRKMRTTG